MSQEKIKIIQEIISKNQINNFDSFIIEIEKYINIYIYE